MALQGNLRDFSLTQILNLINLANKSGALIIQAPDRGARLVFRRGKLAQAEMTGEGSAQNDGLPDILHRSSKITDSQLKTLRLRAAEMSDKELGLLLINAGYVTQQDILDSLQLYLSTVIQRIFTWAEGTFRFEPGQDVPESRISIELPLENLIMQGARQAREWEHLSAEIPNLDMALEFTDRPGVNLKKVNLNVEEWRVVSYITPKNSMRQIAAVARLNDMEIRRIVYGLLQAGLVKMVRPQGTPSQLDGLQSAFPGKPRDEQKNLVNRLIRRIRSI